ncbi:serine/threonine-protein kinase [Kitasatospora sp. NPDC048407]|uniref:serine/threonine-protein kinase n=1 Tax=Kitasatospora sp. NPDC048407 TaxID=3364051 RepID=UPI003721BCDC
MELLTADDPSTIGDYRLLRRLGAGGMGRVYLGRTAGGRTVAVKAVRPELADDPEFRARFRQEVSAARKVGGRWTAPVLDADTEGPRPWVATGYIAGPSLGAAVHTGGPLPAPSVHALGAWLAEALDQVHTLGLVHRDVKPSNVLLTLDGPRLIDFGVARALDAAASLTHSGYVVGSPGFMSPEQAAGSPVGPAGDLFSLGALLAFAATGTAPFGEGVSAAVLLYRVLHEEPELRGLDGELREIVTECLAKDPDRRPTPAELRARLAPGAAAVGPETWLPGPLAAAVGRAAVELLDLEADGAPGVAGPATPAVVDRVPTALDGGAARVAPGAVTEQLERGRRSRVWMAVAAGVVLLGALYGGLAATGNLPWQSGTPGATQSPAAPVPPSGAASSSPPSGGSSGPASNGKALPGAFLGTWKGTITTKVVALPSTFTATFTAGKVGEDVGRTSNASAFSSTVCRGVLTLVSADARTITLRERLDGPQSGCGVVSETQTYTVRDNGAGLHVSVTGAQLGTDPEGDLLKQQ